MVSRSRVFLIHGFNASPRDAWYPWLKQELEKHGIDVHVPQMPHPRWPYIHRWTDHLAQQVGVCDERTFFVGHSLGGQAILRYLATLPSDQRAGGAIFVGGFERLRVWWPVLICAYICLGRWLLQPIDWKKAERRSKRFCAVFSDDDGWVAGDASAGCFEENLRARIRVLHGYGHFTGDEGVFEVPEILEEILQMTGRLDVPVRLTEHTLVSPLRTAG